MNFKSSYSKFKKEFWKNFKNNPIVTKLNMNLNLDNYNNDA